jgi:hypothetical protein
MHVVRLYLPAIVLLLWAAVWAVGVRGNAVIVFGLLATAAAVTVHVREEILERHR